MSFGKILIEPLLKSINIFWLASLKLCKRLTYTRIYLMWFSQLLQEKDETTIQNILTDDQNLQMLQETGFRGNPYKITQSMKPTLVVVWQLLLQFHSWKQKNLNIPTSYCSLWRYKRWLVRNFWELVACELVTFQSKIVKEKRVWKKFLLYSPAKLVMKCAIHVEFTQLQIHI